MLVVQPLMKECRICHVKKPIEDFYVAPCNCDGRQNACKSCLGIQARERNKRKEAKIIRRKSRLKGRYGITEERYQELFEQQKGKCAICGTHAMFRMLSVDHCHDTNAVRGLLCDRCNNGLCKFRDDVELLSSAIDYLTRANET